MDFCAPPGLLPVADALRLMQQAVVPIAGTETVALADTLDRVLVEAIYSPINVPGYDNSAMDGYALRADDTAANASLRVIGQSLAGHVFEGSLGQGECVRIMTGAVIPTGADAVIMQEQVQLLDDQIQLTKSINVGENIRRAGEDIHRGSLVLAQGHRIGPIDIGLLASLGIAQVRVKRLLRVAVLSTGDELIPLGKPLVAGSIYDSNRHALIALLKRMNAEIIDMGLLPDDPAAIEQAFIAATQQADVVISSGGVSVGDADYTKQVLDTLGDIHFWKVAMKPGKPFAFGKLGSGWFFGLPGNPVSAVVTFHQLVLPTLRVLNGEAFTPTPTISAVAATPLKKQPGRADYQRGILRCEQGMNKVYSTGMQSSGMLSSMAQANCYILLEQDRGAVSEGESVQVLPFDQFLN
jgi:molybdopterin molybdotransferase